MNQSLAPICLLSSSMGDLLVQGRDRVQTDRMDVCGHGRGLGVGGGMKQENKIDNSILSCVNKIKLSEGFTVQHRGTRLSALCLL